MTPTYSLFMRQSYLDAWEDFNRSLVREDFPRWDYVVLTASNEAQAEAFRLQLEARREKGMLPKRTVFAVLPDPDGLHPDHIQRPCCGACGDAERAADAVQKWFHRKSPFVK